MESTLTLDDYLAIAKRRIWLVVSVFVVLLAISMLVIHSLPPRYRSTAIVAVESQKIPEGIVQSTVRDYADERIGFVNQRVITPARLLEIIDKHRLCPDQRVKVPAPVLVDELREHIFLETIQDPAKRRGGSSTIAFTLAFEHGDPEVAAAVANDLVTMFLEENVRTRTAQASGTTEFLAQEALRLNALVRTTDRKVAEFKQEHSDALPEHLNLRMDMLQRSEANLRALEREIASLEEEKRFLETQSLSLGAILSAGGAKDAGVVSPVQLLAALKVEVVDKAAIYGSAHPDLRSLRRRIALLEQEVASALRVQRKEPSESETDPATSKIETEITSAGARLTSLRKQKQDVEEKIKGLQARIIGTPQVERALKELTRDYENIRAEYDEIKAKQRDAELAEHLEEQEKAERFVLLEPPMVPSLPVWPNMRKAYALAFALAAAGSAGMAFLAESLDNRIRGPVMLASILRSHPLAVIPFIKSTSDKRRERARRRQWLLLVSLAVLLGALALTHVLYQPLNVLVGSLFDAALR